MAAVEIELEAWEIGHVPVLPLAAGGAHALDRPAQDVDELLAQRADLLVRDVDIEAEDQLAVDVALRVVDAVEPLDVGDRVVDRFGQVIEPKVLAIYISLCLENILQRLVDRRPVA